MAVWKWDGSKFEQTIIRRDNLGLDAYLYCPGPSLAGVKDSEIHVPGAMVFAINTAYPHIRPDVWMGVDWPECYSRNLWHEPFMKCIRNGYQDCHSVGFPIKLGRNTYFLDTARPPKDKPYSFILDRGDTFTWHKNVFMWAIDVMVHIGAKRIHFVGCDLGCSEHDYHDGRSLKEAQRNENMRVYMSQSESLKTLAPMLKMIGVECISCTDVSPLNKFLPYKSLGKSLKDTSSRTMDFPVLDVRDVAASRKRICGITPTRGDRPQFMEQCRGMMDRQTRKLDKLYVIDYAPENDGNDQRERVIRGAKQALADGFRRALIIEDDDCYRNDYVETMADMWHDDIPLIGSWFYTMYHVSERCHITYRANQLGKDRRMNWPTLHSTGVDLETFLRFANSAWLGKNQNLDQDLWEWAQCNQVPYKLVEIPRLVISIKHGVGVQAGGCHTSIKGRPGIERDLDMAWLSRHTDPALHDFYASFGKHHDTELTKIANQYRTDKGNTAGPAHHYTPIYEKFIPRDKPIRLFEIGVGGALRATPDAVKEDAAPSLRMWKDYLHPESTVAGMDCVPKKVPAGIEFFEGDQSNPADLQRVVAAQRDNFDVIIDDGSHQSAHQKASLDFLWPHLAQGGYYCIEDLDAPTAAVTKAAIERVRESGKWNGFSGVKVAHWDGKLAVLQKA